MAGIFYTSSLSEVPLPPGSPDKPLHSMAYLGLAVVVVRAVAGGLPRRIGLRTTLTALLIVIVYAMSDEIHQMFVPGRTADVNDLVADVIGAVMGTIACWAWGIISPALPPRASRDEL